MRFGNAFIPIGAAWSSPFTRWQGALSELSSIDLATQVTVRAMADRELDPSVITSIALGMTVPQREAFYGTPTLAHRIGAATLSGPLIAQACATSAAVLAHAAHLVEVSSDRSSSWPSQLTARATGRTWSTRAHRGA